MRYDPDAAEHAVIALSRADAPFRPASAAASGPTWTQYAVGGLLTISLAATVTVNLPLSVAILHTAFLIVFGLAAVWRAAASGLARTPGRVDKLADAEWPPYTLIAPLYREAAMAPGLIGALSALDYPKDRLQILIVLEADDEETLAALGRIKAPEHVQVIIAPPGVPKTKPRACNVALAMATGRLVVVYDAEDRPHPLQLKEAAARFAVADPRLACLQAPLRILGATRFLSRQFALEYAAQFEIVLPALVRLGAPFPLGGTSNHFRTSVLRTVGGWDAWNVTEDADLGFRLAAQGWRTGLLRTPTWESAPTTLTDWTPQRARWVKGYMQTWGVHMRALRKGGRKTGLKDRFRRSAALQATLGLAILSAFAHGPVMLILTAQAVFALSLGRAPRLPASDFALLTAGWGSAILAMSVGAKSAGLRMGLWEAIAAPFYWALQSWAAVMAVFQLCTRPHHWDKTTHKPPLSTRIGAGLDEVPLDAKGEASVRRAA